jgi:hypothetical protein
MQKPPTFVGRLCHKMTELETPERATRRDVPAIAPDGSRAMVGWIRDRIRHLPLIRQSDIPRGKLPLGSRVIVLKGSAEKDWGQVAIVSKITGSLVEISYRGLEGDIDTRRKQVSSLIRLQEGLELVTCDNGLPLIRRVQQVENFGETGGLVSDTDE